MSFYKMVHGLTLSFLSDTFLERPVRGYNIRNTNDTHSTICIVVQYTDIGPRKAAIHLAVIWLKCIKFVLKQNDYLSYTGYLS